MKYANQKVMHGRIEEQKLARQLKMEQNKLRNELDQAFQATESFVVDYADRMQPLVEFLVSVVGELRGSEDQNANNAHLETLQSTLAQMENVLTQLTKNLTDATTINHQNK